MRQERTVQATIFEVFAGHQIGRELKAISDWLDGQHALLSLVVSDLRREGFEVIHGGQKPNFTEDLHAHGFDVRIMVLSGEITVIRDGKPETFCAGGSCEIPGDCEHATKVGPEGVAYIVGKVDRQIAAN